MERNMAANGPVYFLIREQAKSVVAIKELQARLSVLEDLQERLMQAVQSVQHNLITDKTGIHRVYVPSNSVLSNPCQLSQVSLNPPETDLKQESLNLVPSSKTESKGESINKDSGVGSEYKDHSGDLQHSYVPYNTLEKQQDNKNSDDELLKLLDIIDQKSLQLLQQVEDVGNQKRDTPEKPEENEKDAASSMPNHYVDNVIAQRQLCEIKADRDELKQRLSKLEAATDTVMREKKKLQKELENVIYENQQLQTKIRNANSMNQVSFERSTSAKLSLTDIESATMRRKYLQYSEKSRKKVARVLKESSILELQRQLLTYIMENDVLQAKLEQREQNSLSAWLKIETRLTRELKNANEDIVRLQKALSEKDVEISHLENRIKELEDTLHQEQPVINFGLGSSEDWREPGQHIQKRNLHLSPLEFGDFSKTQSLPATVRLETGEDGICKRSKDSLMYHFNTEEFTDVSLNGNSSSDRGALHYSNRSNDRNAKDEILLDFTDCKESEVSNTSTLMQSCYWNQGAISADWSSVCVNPPSGNQMSNERSRGRNSLAAKHFSAKIVNGHLCWKGSGETPANDLDSICTEFDPLSGTPSCENFVDSLNLSIPLKPAQTVSQSSMVDSLHSASLDLGCASSAVWHHSNPKLSNSFSVDGIRQLLIEPEIPNFYKNRTLPSCGQNSSITSMISGKTAHPRPANIADCMHSFSDQKLL